MFWRGMRALSSWRATMWRARSYDLVVHLVTAADGAEDAYAADEARAPIDPEKVLDPCCFTLLFSSL